MYRRTRPAAAVESLEVRTLFAVATFTIDPALSSIRLSGEVADVFDIEAQHDGSLTQVYQGSIVADVRDGVISFPGGSSIVAQALKKYDPGTELANYGAKGETGGLFSVKLGEAAVRNFAFDLDSGDVALSDVGAFSAGGLDVHTTAGRLDYDLRVGGDGDVDLDDKRPNNDAAGNATLRGEGENRTLTIPVDFAFDAGSTELRFRGTLVATTGSGAPVDPNAVRIGEGTLLKTVQFTDADGTATTVTLSGGGSADVRFANATQQTPGKAGTVAVSGTGLAFLGIDAVATTSRTKLVITGKGGADRVVDVPSLTTDGAAASVGGKGVVFSGPVTLGGRVTALIASRLSGATVTADSVGTVKVAGDVTNSTLTFNGVPTDGPANVRSFSATGAFSGSRLSAAGVIGPVKARTITGSEIYSAVGGTAGRFPATADVASGGAVGNVTARTFADSVIAADTVGMLKLGTIVTANSGDAFGVTTDTLGGLTAADESKQKVKVPLTTDPAALAAALAAQAFTTGDFQIRLK